MKRTSIVYLSKVFDIKHQRLFISLHIMKRTLAWTASKKDFTGTNNTMPTILMLELPKLELY